MRLTVLGATGRTGRPLVDQALARGHEVVAFVRDPDTFPVTHDRLTVVTGDAYTGEGLAAALADPDSDTTTDAVVSVLGQHSSGPDDLLTVAGDHTLAAMAAAGVDRYVTLVGAGVRTEDDTPSLSGRVMGLALRVLAGEVLADAREHVRRVRASATDWTVVRAPRLTDDAGTGAYRAGTDVELGFESVARADVATFILDCIEADRHVGELPKVGAA